MKSYSSVSYRVVLILLLSFSSAWPLMATAESSKSAVVKEVRSMVNINTASAQMLAETLKGIGIKKAKAIVAYRDKNGKFSTLEELKKVSGIGQATIDKNRQLIAFR